LRRRIETGPDGRYELQTIIPAGYSCAPDGPTQRLLDQLGRHGQRPAHIHFFVSAPGHRHLTTQINIAGDKYLYDDFAFATREGLIPKIVRHEDAKKMKERGLKPIPWYTTVSTPSRKSSSISPSPLSRKKTPRTRSIGVGWRLPKRSRLRLRGRQTAELRNVGITRPARAGDVGK
jgi:hypothetical protein